ncbi:MAG: hypothetical protein MPJ79_06460 [Alphaproteobacteria bacterium]|nr:hypothetical protein [Alphaproteobacteria bacterium]MDA7983746.1 hypothetical protein [Alphaproteobacteria bacterium]MDA7989159.1 hypothetical protein [Alphaproteobacteria bacterium]MDA8009986.1 hypothetical protein [Alphaproteobacteria bacterium]
MSGSGDRRRSSSAFEFASEALSGAAGLAQGIEREGRTLAKDVARRVSHRLDLVDGEEVAALSEQLRLLTARVERLESAARTKKAPAKRAAKTAPKKATPKAAKSKPRVSQAANGLPAKAYMQKVFYDRNLQGKTTAQILPVMQKALAEAGYNASYNTIRSTTSRLVNTGSAWRTTEGRTMPSDRYDIPTPKAAKKSARRKR